MKGNKEDKIIRELFRKKLENVEVIPGASIKTDLMRKLAKREFLRFNPGKFNIFYLGGILVSGLITVLLLYSGSGKESKSSLLITSEFEDTTSVKSNINSDDYVITQRSIKTGRIGKKSSEPNENAIIVSRGKNSPDNTSISNLHQNMTDIPRSEVSSSLSKKGLFSESGNDKNNLKSYLKANGALFEPSISSGCIPLKVHFLAGLTSRDSCHWTFGDGGSSFEKEPEWIFDVEGEYKVVLTVFAPDGSGRTSSTVIIVYPRPLARFELSPENPLVPEDEIQFINYSTDAVKCKWDFGDGSTSELFEPRHKYKKSGNYNIELVVYSDNGCSDSLFIINPFAGLGYFIRFPNAFIPNPGGPTGGYFSPISDESAHIFHPVTFGVSEYQLRIFSKRGLLIFESNDVNIGWDGYLNGQLCESGVYIWKVRGNFINGETFIKMGDVTLLKNVQ